MQRAKRHRAKVAHAITSGVLAIVMVVGLQAPFAALATKAYAADAPANSTITVSGYTESVHLDYGSDTTQTLTITTNREGGETIAITASGPISASSGFTLQQGETKTLTVTLNPNKNLSIGEHDAVLTLMPQSDRRAHIVKYKITVRKATITVTSPVNVERYYGQTLNLNQVMVNTNAGQKSLGELGLTSANLNNPQTNVGEYSETLTAQDSGNYALTGAPTLNLKVKKATPELVGVKGTNLTAGSPLKNSTISGSALNPYTRAAVAGTWSWMYPDELASITSGTSQTKSYEVKFTPTDTTNYMEQRAFATLTVLSSGGPSGGGTTGDGADPQLKVTGGTWTYDRAQHAPNVTKEGVGAVTITYTDESGATTTNPPKNAGRYTAKVTLAPTVQYRGAEATAQIVINQRLVNLKTTGDAIQSRPYNGTRTATVDASKILLDNYYREDNVSLSLGNVTAEYGSPNVGEYVVLIQCPNATLVGSDAANYKLNAKSASEKSSIFKRPASVHFNGVMEKEYGQTFNFGNQGSGYTIETGAATDKTGVLPNDVKSINLTSAGAAANASVGTYAVSALGAGANYDLKVNGTGTLRVTQATPLLRSASAGSGKIGAKLSSVPVPIVTYVNKNNGEAVPGTVTWTNPNQTIGTATTAAGTSASYSYTFTPNNQGNYKSVSGTVEVTATTKTPVNIQATRTAFTYDGQPHEVSHATSTSGATVNVTYKVGGSWVTTPPTNVGEYEFKIVADLPDSAEYADNEIDGKMTISPLTPTGQPKVSGDGATLSAYKLDAATIVGVGGKAVNGTIAWDNPSAAVKAGDKYAWTFTSQDSNYNNAKGTIIPKALANAEVVDKSKLQAALTTANTVLASAQVSSNGLEIEPAKQWVTNTVNDVLLKAIASANSCITEGGATQKMVNEALANLNTAVNSFKASMQAGLKGTDKGAVEKKASTVDIATNRYDAKPGDAPITISVGGEGDGALFAFSDNDAVASAVATGSTVTVTPVSQGTAVVTVSRAATDTHEQASKNIGIIVGEAPEGYVPPTEEAVDGTPEVTPVAPDPIIRVYNPNTGAHLFVKQTEANKLASVGWRLEGGAKTAESGTPVYRLYNQWSGEHHYTTNLSEYNALKAAGWNGEDVQFYSDDAQAVKVYRLWNGQQGAGSHHYTSSVSEYQTLLDIGWQYEGIGWYYVG